jgi:hypothetical protein
VNCSSVHVIYKADHGRVSVHVGDKAGHGSVTRRDVNLKIVGDEA